MLISFYVFCIIFIFITDEIVLSKVSVGTWWLIEACITISWAML